MDKNVLQQAEQYTHKRKRRKAWKKVVTSLGAVVVFVTTYSLILPAITMEQTVSCGMEEHQHSALCYEAAPVEPVLAELICEPEVHSHSEDCYDTEGELICGLADFLIHTHNEICYCNDELICPLPEVEEHAHDETCVETKEVLICELEEDYHVHNETCYTVENGQAVCELEESEGHTHHEECYSWTDELTCGEDEQEGHVHTDDCYTWSDEQICTVTDDPDHVHTEACYTQIQGELICGEEERDGHQHTDTCYTRTQGEPICELEESEGHTHNDECFEQVQTLTCETTENPEGHIHAPECYEGKDEIICGKEPVVIHTHDETCLDETGTLICGILAVEEHVHTEDCLHIPESVPEEDVLICLLEEHAHTEECMEYPIQLETTEDVETNCGMAAHGHDESCYTSVLICEILPEEDHDHTEDCYETEMTCELEEHTHSLACQSNPEADVETASEWEDTFSDVELSGEVSGDLLEIAKSQLGYTESQENFAVAEDGVTTFGYTRYGEWYGEPYSRWDVIFLSFCAEYAGADTIPKVSDAEDLIDALQDLYWAAEDYTPAAGDLIFFDTDDDGIADHAGIVEEFSVSNMTIQTIEGDVDDQVQRKTYDIAEAGIVGYAQLSQTGEDYPVGFYSSINVSGTKMYNPKEYITYQGSSHQLSGDYSVLYYPNTYVLIPEEYFDYAASMEEWATPMPWTASDGTTNMNYVVAYCADRETDVSEDGEWYTTQLIWDSDYEACAELLAGIVQHSYPYITAEEMRAELEAAYEDGEISIDLSCCTESDYIAAVQWAIWDATGLSDPQKYASGSTFPSYNTNETLNPLSDPGHTNEYDIQEHVEAIRDWLMTQTAPGNLEIEDHESVITKNENGTYDIETTVTLDRALEKEEELLATFSAGDRTSAANISGEGTREFTVKLTGLTAEEVLNAQVNLDVEFERMQVYIYDSASYQDMISGQWGVDSYKLSFDIEAETTSVDVTKYWSNNESGADYIEVQLYADGEEYGDPVRLSDNNDWTYTWEDLLKYSAPGVTIEYTMEEILVPGYLTTITKDESGARVITTFNSATAFEEGATYIFTYTENGALNALGDETGGGGSGLDWIRNLDVTDTETIPDTALWTASGVSSDGTNAYLRNNATGNYLSYDGTHITLSASASAKTYFLYNHFYLLNGDVNQYLVYLDGGEGYTTNVWDSALAVTSYRRVQVERTTADISFLITNTKTDEDTSVSVTKNWAGRTDGNYPDSVEVNLLQNGELYGPSVTLNAENGWYYRWDKLPLKLGDTQYVYTVEEAAIEGYTVTVYPTADEDGTLLFEVTNTWSPEYVPLLLSKVDAFDSDTLLSGAQFRLYLVAEEGDREAVPIPGTADAFGVPTETITMDDGTFQIERIWVGRTYYLVETAAPKGYDVLAEPIVFAAGKDEDGAADLTILSGDSWTLLTREDGDLLLQIKNKQTYVLPETGGVGTNLYTMGGLLLMAAAVTFLLYNHKPRRKEDFTSS